MRPKPRNEATRSRLQRQKQRDTQPELQLRRALHHRRLRYRVDRKVEGLRSRPDVVFGPAKVAVFVDGCFWHGCPEHATAPKNNSEWWRQKLESNVERDRRVDAFLRDAGWEVIRVWEHEDPIEAADSIERAVRSRQSQDEGIDG